MVIRKIRGMFYVRYQQRTAIARCLAVAIENVVKAAKIDANL